MKNSTDEDLKILSMCVYKKYLKNKTCIPKDYIELSEIDDKKNGFYSKLFYKDNKLFIIFRGTDDFKDVTENDINLGLKQMPTQIINARQVYNNLKKEFPNKKIYLIGHSLGGSLAQILGSETKEKTVTFNAYGVKDLIKTDNRQIDNIINYGNKNDFVFISNIQNQLGKTYIINKNENNLSDISKQSYTKRCHLTFNRLQKYHTIENMGDLSTALEYKGENLQTEETVLFKLSVEKNVDLRFADSDTIITTEEIGKMSSDEFVRNEECIYQKLKEGKIMPEVEAKKRHLSVQNSNNQKANTQKQTSQSQNKDGHWVIINGNHILID